jgi:hypothetical protein
VTRPVIIVFASAIVAEGKIVFEFPRGYYTPISHPIRWN